MILERIVKSIQKRVEKLKELDKVKEFKKNAHPLDNPFSFEKAMKKQTMGLICEIKKASPSKGIISNEFLYLKIAKDYEKCGAAAISVLTEPEFFMGKNEYLSQIKESVTLPILRKDFIIDELQIYESRYIGADAILLIAAILDVTQIKGFVKIADDLGMSVLVEAHNEDEIKKAIVAGARMIGVNNRNLKTFEVNINHSIQLRQLVPSEIVFVSESGIRNKEDTDKLRINGVNAVLIGELLMKSGNISQIIRELSR